MKKLLIVGYFVGMFTLTYLTAKAIGVYGSGDVEVKFVDHEYEMNDTEISNAHIAKKEHADVVMQWKTKETRTKSFFGWTTKIDTLQKPTPFYIEHGK